MIYKRYKVTFRDSCKNLSANLQHLIEDSYNGYEIYPKCDNMIVPWDASLFVISHKIKLLGSASPGGFGTCSVTVTPQEFNYNVDVYVWIDETIEDVEDKFDRYGWVLRYTGTKYNEKTYEVMDQKEEVA